MPKQIKLPSIADQIKLMEDTPDKFESINEKEFKTENKKMYKLKASQNTNFK